MSERVMKTEAEWKQQLTSEQYQVTRQKATETAFAGRYWNTKAKGIYQCLCCGSDLFSSDTKVDSGAWWPSFWAPIAKENISAEMNNNLSMRRAEVLCSRCDGPPRPPL